MAYGSPMMVSPTGITMATAVPELEIRVCGVGAGTRVLLLQLGRRSLALSIQQRLDTAPPRTLASFTISSQQCRRWLNSF